MVAMLSLPLGLGSLRPAPLAGSSQTPGTIQGRALHDALAAFAPPHHERCHQQGDQHGQHDEGTQHTIRGVVQCPARRGAVPEVLLVHGHEELVHQPVGPVAVEPLSDQRRAVRQLPVSAATHRDIGWHRGGTASHGHATFPPCSIYYWIHYISCI